MLASLTLLRRTNSEKLQFRGCMCLWNDMMADLTPSTLRIVHLLFYLSRRRRDQIERPR